MIDLHWLWNHSSVDTTWGTRFQKDPSIESIVGGPHRNFRREESTCGAVLALQLIGCRIDQSSSDQTSETECPSTCPIPSGRKISAKIFWCLSQETDNITSHSSAVEAQMILPRLLLFLLLLPADDRFALFVHALRVRDRDATVFFRRGGNVTWRQRVELISSDFELPRRWEWSGIIKK